MLPTSSERSMQTYTYHSRSHQYNSNETPDLQLTLREYGQDSIEIELKNLQYSAQKQQKIKHIVLLLLVYAAYTVSTANASILVNGHVLCDISLLLWLLYRCINLFSLIQTENVLFCLDLALQCHTVRFLHRSSNMFIPANKIYDLVINEVIENVRKPRSFILNIQPNSKYSHGDLSFWNTYKTYKPSSELLALSTAAHEVINIICSPKTPDIQCATNSLSNYQPHICWLDVHYILIVRTQGDLFQKKPIITLFNTMSPSFGCLQQIYNCLNKRMRNSSTPS